MPDRTERRTAIDIPWRTIFKVLAAIAIVWLWLQLIQLILVVIVAILLAVTLEPVVAWFLRRGLPRWAAATLVGFVLLALVGGFFWITWASLSDQLQYVTQHVGEIERGVTQKLPPWVRQMIGDSNGGDVASRIAPYALRFARSLASAVIVALLGFIVTLYLLIEADRTKDWLMAFVAKEHRPRMERTLEEARAVIYGYVAGNVATSIFATIFVFVTLSILKVPAALLLALLAGLFDFVPVLGFILSVIPALALAASVSTNTVVIVALLYVAYHTIENYLIAPYVYGDRLKLSNVAVILAFAIGAEIAGVIGALIALPIAAAYPAVERIWLRDTLAEDTVRDHRAIERRKAG